jgi:hypothetical protein
LFGTTGTTGTTWVPAISMGYLRARARAISKGASMAGDSKFTPEVRQTILDWIKRGCFRCQACAAAGISRRTLNRWEARSREDPDGEFGVFIDELQLAQDAADARLAVVHNALATGTEVEVELDGENPVDLAKVDLRALHFRMERGGSRAWAERGRGNSQGDASTSAVPELEVVRASPQMAARLVREIFGDHARRALVEDARVRTPDDLSSGDQVDWEIR